MGKQLFGEVWDVTRRAWAVPSAPWRVLFILAAYADDDTGEAVITVGHVGKLARISERQTLRCLNFLKAEGFVTVSEPGRGQGRPNVYRVTVPLGWAPTRRGAWWEAPSD